MEDRRVISSIENDNADRTDICMDLEENSRAFCNVFYFFSVRESIRG